jgi:peptidoglycan/xylan/chitin deacetylase (PgdA/CDA1 family)
LWARVPTLELHIALLRHQLADANVSYVEIPPRPHAARFICCLTHDVDFLGIRRQRLNPTLAGFALRGTVGTIVDTVRGRRPVNEAVRNVLAVLSLPLILLRLRDDLWNPFRDYARADRGHAATFFLVPFSNHPGIAPHGAVEPRRAVSYDIDDIEEQLATVPTPDRELAVHGLDTWRDAQRGRAEREALTRITGQPRTGVRMHWLYFAEESPRRIEEAGFDYDSTCGYNDAVGYRAGTLQAFRPAGAERLLELPLAIMDSAMLYPERMGLSHDEAVACGHDVVRQARECGGALVINWHDRSLAPERQWGRLYDELLNAVEAEGGMFLSAGQAVDWFRWRRSVRFHEEPGTGEVTVSAPAPSDGLPQASIAVRSPDGEREIPFGGGSCQVGR